jgi:hypothetical protein
MRARQRNVKRATELTRPSVLFRALDDFKEGEERISRVRHQRRDSLKRRKWDEDAWVYYSLYG